MPAPLAARVWGTAGHAHDWDDTQVSQDPAHVYGLLTHPTIPPLTAALVVADMLGQHDGRAVMLAFQLGFEVECKISEWMLPCHYRRGHHYSGTVGTFGACVAAAKLLGLTGPRLAHAFGLSLYLSRFADYNATYGSLGVAIARMMWIWLSACAVLIGAELNAEMEHQTACGTTTRTPLPMGGRGVTMADTVA